MKRFLTVVTGVLVGLIGFASAAFAQTQVNAVTTAASAIKDDMITVGTTVLPYAAAVLILVIGWKFAKKFVRG